MVQACPMAQLSVVNRPKAHAVALQLISQCPDCLLILGIYDRHVLQCHLRKSLPNPSSFRGTTVAFCASARGLRLQKDIALCPHMTHDDISRPHLDTPLNGRPL